jgi:hypothetical protein
MPRFNHWAASAALVIIAGSSPAFAQSAACDRACLRTMLDGYLAAVIAHDPSKAQLAIGFRQTENAINYPQSKGVWQSVTALGGLQRRYFDPVTGQAGYYGTVMEGSDAAIVTIRLRVENRKITEAEWYLGRPNDPGMSGPRRAGGPPANNYNPEYLTANPPRQTAVPVAQRVDRETLRRVVDSYFDAITSHDGAVAVTHKGCGRVENGTPAPGGAFLPPLPRREGAPAPAGPPPGTAGGQQQPAGGITDCVAGLQNFNALIVAARRIPLIDEEAQMALATGVFIRRPGSPTPRLVSSWWFVIDEGRIRTTYTAMFYPPPTLAVPNWPPYDGNWPLPAEGAAAAPAAAPARGPQPALQ